MAADRLDGLFAAFFRDLAIAWRSLSSYPSGHPAAVNGLAKACTAIAALLAETGPLELTATRDALFWSERRFTSPTALQLARLLRRRRAAACSLEPGLAPSELATFLHSLALDAKSAREAGSLAEELANQGLVRVRVHDLDFSAVAMVEDDEEMSSAPTGPLAQRLVRRLLTSTSLPAAELAAWIHSGRSAGALLQLLIDSAGTDPALAGWGSAAFPAALQAAIEDFFEAPDAERAAGLAALHRRLRGAPRERFVAELAAAVSRHAAATGTNQAALAELQAAFPAEVAAQLHRTTTPEASRGASEPGSAGPAPRLLPHHLAELRRAFAASDLDALAEQATDVETLEVLLALPEERPEVRLSPAAEEVARELADATVERASVVTLLELAECGEVAAGELPPILQRLEVGYRRFLADGRVRQAIALLERVQRHAAGDDARPTAFRHAAERMSGRESLQALVGAMPEMSGETLALLPELLQRLGPTAVRHLLGVLAETDNRSLRHLLLDLLAGLGPAVVRDATALLADTRWYVVRNMLLLLRRVGDPGSVPAVRRCADHADLRVRLEAIRNLFAFDPDVPRELLRRALTHSDPRQAEAAMELAGEHAIAEAVEPIVSYLRAIDLFGRRRSVRLKAIRALAAIGDPAALDGLGRFRARYPLWPPAIEERRELYRTLSSYPQAARRAWVESGLRARDAEIRRLAATLTPAAEGLP